MKSTMIGFGYLLVATIAVCNQIHWVAQWVLGMTGCVIIHYFSTQNDL